MHWASARATEVTVQTPPWWPTSVSPSSSLGGEHNLVTMGGPLELLLGGEGLQGERPLLVPVTGRTQAGPIAPTASATSATAAPSTTDRLPASAEPLSWSCVVLL
jgi:hypothetical protein